MHSVSARRGPQNLLTNLNPSTPTGGETWSARNGNYESRSGGYRNHLRRTAASSNPNCQRIYSFEADRYDRSTPLTSKELDVRARFSAVAAAVKARKSDLNQITTDQQNFAAQKDTAGGKKTMKAYLWKVCGDAYDAAHNG